ncbi:MAG: hypothetical protein GXP42_06330 [Chloroflexi bacterium]|nr:hypothetical protein [Chloroflexota bacterium]
MLLDAILGLDIGTTSTKAILFDLAGRELGAAQETYPLQTPHPGWVEQDPEEVWRALQKVLRDIAGQTPRTHRVRALAMAAQSGSVIPANEQGDPVYPMITWLDTRTESLVEQWKREGLEPEVRELSGWWLHPGLPFPAIGWLRQHRPDVFARARRFLSVHDFLAHRLTGRFFIDRSCAAEMQLVDIRRGEWSPRLCAMVGVTPDHLSTLGPAAAIIGPLLDDVSRETGLPADALLVSGGHDQCCAALAMGMIDPGEVKLACGTAWVITGIVDNPDLAAIPPSMDLNFHVVPDRWTISQLLGGFGASVEWMLREVVQSRPPAQPLTREELFAAFDALVSESEPTARGLLFVPHSGPSQLANASAQGGFWGLRLDHTCADMARAVLEGVAFEVRWTLNALREKRLPVERLWLVGGATRSPHWPQILADVAQTPVALAGYAHWPALGAAILAGMGVGAFDDFSHALNRFKRPAHVLEPNRQLSSPYAEAFENYRRLANAIL